MIMICGMIAAFMFFCAWYCYMDKDFISMIVCAAIGVGFLKIRSNLKKRKAKRKEAEAQMARTRAAAYQESEEKESGSLLGSVILGIICLPFTLIKCAWNLGDTGSAEKHLHESQEYYKNDLVNHQERQRQKNELLQQAQNLENQSRYGMPYQQKELRKRAEDLRRQAGRL